MREYIIFMFEKNELYSIGLLHFQQFFLFSIKFDLMIFFIKSVDTLSGQSILAPVFLLDAGGEMGWHIIIKILSKHL